MDASIFIDTLHKKMNFSPFIGVPCSYMSPIISYLEDCDAEYINAVNEGNAIATAFGLIFAKKKPVVIMQNSGIGNMFQPYVTYIKQSRMPLLFIISMRNNDDKTTEQHEYMGENTLNILHNLGFETIELNENVDEVPFNYINDLIEHKKKSTALIIKKNIFNNYQKTHLLDNQLQPTYKDIFEKMLSLHTPEIRYFVGLGFVSRMFYSVFKNIDCCLYILGAMGYASSMASGFSHASKLTVVSIEGDGSVLMHLENLASIGNLQLNHFIHIIMDNGIYNSTGGQKNISDSIELCNISISCGYTKAYDIDTIENFIKIYKKCLSRAGKFFLRVHINKNQQIVERTEFTIKDNVLEFIENGE